VAEDSADETLKALRQSVEKLRQLSLQPPVQKLGVILAESKSGSTGAEGTKSPDLPHSLPAGLQSREFPRLFDLLNLVRQGCWVDDCEKVCSMLGLSPRIPPASLSYPYVTEEVTSSARFSNSVEAILQCTVAALREGPLTREALVEKTRYQRKRISSALGPYLGLGLLLLPATLRTCPDIDKVIIRSSPGSNMTVVRNIRLEAAGFAINAFCEYYWEVRKLRMLLQALAGQACNSKDTGKTEQRVKSGSGSRTGTRIGAHAQSRGSHRKNSRSVTTSGNTQHSPHADPGPTCSYLLKTEFAGQRLDELRRGEGKWKEIHRKEEMVAKTLATFTGNPSS